MENPIVTITNLTETSLAKQKGKGVNLGNASLNATINSLLNSSRKDAKKIFHLKWEGDKIPRGAVIEGMTIGWTQNGMVNGTDKEDRDANIGTYERLVEFGGATGREQQMLVFVH